MVGSNGLVPYDIMLIPNSENSKVSCQISSSIFPADQIMVNFAIKVNKPTAISWTLLFQFQFNRKEKVDKTVMANGNLKRMRKVISHFTKDEPSMTEE